MMVCEGQNTLLYQGISHPSLSDVINHPTTIIFIHLHQKVIGFNVDLTLQDVFTDQTPVI